MSLKKVSKKQEMRITRSLKEIKEEARTTINSGSIWFDKSDIVSKNFRIEAKTRVKPSKSITIQKEWLDKVGNEAFETGKLPALAFSFGDNRDYYILDQDTFLLLVEKLKEDE